MNICKKVADCSFNLKFFLARADLTFSSDINVGEFHAGVKDVYFRMDAGNKSASISISLEHQDLDIQEIYFSQFTEFNNLLHEILDEP